MTGVELIRLLARTTAEDARRRAAGEAFGDWLEEAIANPDDQLPPFVFGYDDDRAHRISGFDSMWAMPVTFCDLSLDTAEIVGWDEPLPDEICAECGGLEPEELTFRQFMIERGRRP